MPISTDPKKNRAFYWTLILGILALFLIRRTEIVVRLTAVGVFFLVLKQFFDSFYDTLTRWHAEADEATQPHGQRPREEN